MIGLHLELFRMDQEWPFWKRCHWGRVLLVISLPRGCPAQLPAAMLSTMMVMDSNALEPSPQIKHFFL